MTGTPRSPEILMLAQELRRHLEVLGDNRSDPAVVEAELTAIRDKTDAMLSRMRTTES